MVDPWWSLLGAAIPAIIAGQALRMKKRRAEEQRLKSARGREKSSDEIFVCERVCTSKRMLKKVGALSKDPTIDTCVTVCGVSELDACADACARTVCVNQHQVPNWNDICLRRCQTAGHHFTYFNSLACSYVGDYRKFEMTLSSMQYIGPFPKLSKVVEYQHEYDHCSQFAAFLTPRICQHMSTLPLLAGDLYHQVLSRLILMVPSPPIHGLRRTCSQKTTRELCL
ncbi:unnamed protein product [Dovyalis caffra]|uniref:Uncharacterized protein n=1 Tax=Dovyalis caffra TaxID=77055 RepID=A0AAV1SA68_9ROSI|nr:unnamed protein product [Dovyalis caffra]